MAVADLQEDRAAVRSRICKEAVVTDLQGPAGKMCGLSMCYVGRNRDSSVMRELSLKSCIGWRKLRT